MRASGKSQIGHRYMCLDDTLTLMRADHLVHHLRLVLGGRPKRILRAGQPVIDPRSLFLKFEANALVYGADQVDAVANSIELCVTQRKKEFRPFPPFETRSKASPGCSAASPNRRDDVSARLPPTLFRRMRLIPPAVRAVLQSRLCRCRRRSNRFPSASGCRSGAL